MSRILYVATSDIHLKTFHVPYLEWLAGEGHRVDIAAERRAGLSFDCVHRAYWLPFPRSLASSQHFPILRRLREIIDSGDYDLVHCHTPIPSALTRLAARNWRQRGGKVLYTAHGFHFYRGGPWINWLTYYPAEWLLSGMTDAIITINREDYSYVKGRMRHKHSYLIPGIGVQTDRFRALAEHQKHEARRQLGYADDDFLMLYIAEFIPRKNHRFLIGAIGELVKTIPNLRCLLAGTGALLESVQAEVERRGLTANVRFLGFRADLERVAALADIGVSTSKHEGLGMGLLEQMVCGVPVVASDDKGHREFVEDGLTGFLYPKGDQKVFSEAIARLYHNQTLRGNMGKLAMRKAQHFAIQYPLESMKVIYRAHLT